MDWNENYSQMFSDLGSLMYQNHEAYEEYFYNDRYIPNITIIADNNREVTGFQDISTGHVIFHDWDRLEVYDRDGGYVFRIIVEP